MPKLGSGLLPTPVRFAAGGTSRHATCQEQLCLADTGLEKALEVGWMAAYQTPVEEANGGTKGASTKEETSS